ncbi:MAG: hypothetical protein GY786_23205, partial [Proteobacteria bacterium]|nr:hypothetical protein [Pseudomonadota bacterium]
MLIADKQKIKVFQLTENGANLILAKEPIGESSITQATFDQKSDLLWSTQHSVYKTEVSTGNTKKLAKLDASKGGITSLNPLRNDQFVVSQEKSSSISWFSETSIGNPVRSKGDDSPIVGTFTNDGFILHGVSENNNFLSWDLLTKQLTRKVKLGEQSKQKTPNRVSLNEKGDRVWIAYGDKKNPKTEEHKLSSLKKGISTPKRIKAYLGDSSSIYRKVEALLEGITDSIKFPDEKLNFKVDLNSGRKGPRTGGLNRQDTLITGNYKLAKIEADNGDFDAALKFIRKVPTSDPEFRKSRELQKQVYSKIELQNSVDAARKQYQQGNYESARILVDNILDESPSNPAARRLKSRMEKRLTVEGKRFFIIIGAVLLILLCLGVLIWYNKDEILRLVAKKNKAAGIEKGKKKDHKKSSVKETNKENAPEKESRNIRRKFLLKFEETKILLRDSITKDNEGVYKEKWMEFAAHLKNIEKKGVQTPENYPALDKQLNHLQKLIIGVSKI